MKCNQCGAPATPGGTICEYCGGALEFGAGAPVPGAPAPGAPVAGPAPGMAPPGASPPPGANVPGGGTPRALAPDGCWYPVAASPVAGKFLVRFSDGRQATLPPGEVREPVPAHRAVAGVRVLGEFENRYYPGTIMDGGNGSWTVQFDDGENASVTADRMCVFDAPQPPLSPGTQVLAQSRQDGCWYPGRIMSGPDQNGRQRVRVDAGGTEDCTRAQINGPAGPDLAQQKKRVMGIGPDGLWYPGTVQQVGQGQIYIKFDDNEEAWVMSHEVRFIC